MSGYRNEPLPAGSARRNAGDVKPAFGKTSFGKTSLGMPRGEPHGYDPVEFGPGESRRDFPGRRERRPDEERRLLKEAQAAFEGPEKRHDVDDGPDVDAAGPVHDAEHDTGRPSRLYRE